MNNEIFLKEVEKEVQCLIDEHTNTEIKEVLTSDQILLYKREGYDPLQVAFVICGKWARVKF